MTWDAILGWSSDTEPFYAKLAETLPKGARFVEVGCLLGRSIACMGTLRPDLDLWAVDTWDATDWGEPMTAIVRHHGGLWPAFLGEMRAHAPDVLDRLHVVRAKSTDVTIKRVDVVFIDACHEYEAVLADIEHWTPLVKRGGIVSGHDRQPDHPGVEKAVSEHFTVSEVNVGPGEWSSVWYVRR